VSELFHVTLEESQEVGAEPCIAASRVGSAHDLRISSPDQPRKRLGAGGRRRGRGKRGGSKQSVHESFLASLDFSLGQRPQRQNLHPPGQRFGDLGQEQDVRGAGQQIAPGSALPVNLDLQRREELGSALDLIEHDRTVERFDEAGGVRQCRG
jgi:hypothetical protein